MNKDEIKNIKGKESEPTVENEFVVDHVQYRGAKSYGPTACVVVKDWVTVGRASNLLRVL